jgi:meiotically up-regulated gene 157 (Mug157) protein
MLNAWYRAQWLRDTGNQFAHLYKLLPQDDNLKALVKAIINTEARYIYQYPYCGMYHRYRELQVHAKTGSLTRRRLVPTTTRVRP